MSIIYEALKKTQQLSDQKISPKAASSATKVDIVLLAIIAVLFCLVIVSYYPKFKLYLKNSFSELTASHLTSPVPATPIEKSKAQLASGDLKLQIVQPTTNQSSLNLSGVFISNQEKVALINNQALHIGDTINGKKIISIQYDVVKLADESHTYILHAS